MIDDGADDLASDGFDDGVGDTGYMFSFSLFASSQTYVSRCQGNLESETRS